MTVLDPVIGYLMAMYEMSGSHRVLSLARIMNGAGRPRKPVLRVLDKLVGEGYLVQINDSPVPNGRREYGPARRNPEWRIVRDLTDRPAARPRKNTLRDKIWKLIRIRLYFTKADLVFSSGASPATVDEYVRLLEKWGHIRRTGKDGRFVHYMVINNQVERPVSARRKK